MIHTITQWRHTQTGNLLYLCGDVHMDFAAGKQTHKQQEAFIEAAHERKAFVIFEGGLDYNGQDPAIMNYIAWYKANHKRIIIGQLALLENALEENFDADTVQSWTPGIEISSLHSLGARLSAQGIAHDNVEFRHLYTASLNGQAVSYQRVLDYTQEIIAHIRTFNDGPACTAFYEERINRFIANNSDLYHQSTLNIKCNLAKPLNQFHGGWVTRCVLYGQELLDALIVHSIIKHAMHKTTIVASGSDHIRIVNDFLPQIGYERVHSYGSPYWRSEDNVRMAFNPLDLTATLTPGIKPKPKAWYQRLTALWS